MGKIQKVVIDTNVILSAFGWGGKPLQIIELLEQGMIRNCVSEQTLKELIVALAYPKLAFSHATQTSTLNSVLSTQYCVLSLAGSCGTLSRGNDMWHECQF